MQFIGIIGDDHCGSTVLARALASLPGVESAGEVHWLADIKPGQAGIMRAGWSVSRSCVVHGADCPIFDVEMRTAEYRHCDVYAAVAAHVLSADDQTHHVVSTDKYPALFKRALPPKQMLGVVLYKPPFQAFYSQTRTNKHDRTTAMINWLDIYREALHWAKSYCHRVAWVPYMDFAICPVKVLQRIVAVLGLETEEPHEIILPTDYHFIGGNQNAHKTKRITLDTSWMRLTDDETTELHQRQDLREVYSALSKHSQDQRFVMHR